MATGPTIIEAPKTPTGGAPDTLTGDAPKTPVGDAAASGVIFNPVQRTAEIAFRIREELRKALPAPIERFFTVMAPGKVLNLTDYSAELDEDGKLTEGVVPPKTEVNEAILCDDMPALASVQLGPTGNSVARSYRVALNKLIPIGTTAGVEVADVKNLSEDEKHYKQAMDWLTHRDVDQTYKTRVDIYSEKQKAYVKTMEAKTKAFDDALQRAMNNPLCKSQDDKQAAYNAWVSENARAYDDSVQAAHMDWVVNGMKAEVERYFSIVDRSSATARVEAGKKATRFAVVRANDGSVEYQQVKLTPPNWAALAKKKVKTRTRTTEWYAWEISRLQSMNSMLKALLEKAVPSSESDTVTIENAIWPKKDQSNDDVQKAAPSSESDTVTIEDVIWPNEDQSNDDVEVKSSTFIGSRDVYASTMAGIKASPEEQGRCYKAHNDAREALKQVDSQRHQNRREGLHSLGSITWERLYAVSRDFAQELIDYNTEQITVHAGTVALRVSAPLEGESKVLIDALMQDAGMRGALPDPESEVKADTDYFTAIVVEIPAFTSLSSRSLPKVSFGGSAGWGLFGSGGSTAHFEAPSKIEEAMAKHVCKISFECMRVEVARSWLRPELFYDLDLTADAREPISPGFYELRRLMESKDPSDETDLQRYGTFPMYPIAFLLAVNIVLEFTDEKNVLESYFKIRSATEDRTIVNFEPFTFSISSTSKHSSLASYERTGDGCRIAIDSPQIIGCVSQILPALPRLKKQQTPI